MDSGRKEERRGGKHREGCGYFSDKKKLGRNDVCYGKERNYFWRRGERVGKEASGFYCGKRSRGEIELAKGKNKRFREFCRGKEAREKEKG